MRGRQSLLLLWITNNLAIAEKIREKRRCVVQIFTKSVGHQIVDGAVERIVEGQQLLGKGNLCRRACEFTLGKSLNHELT